MTAVKVRLDELVTRAGDRHLRSGAFLAWVTPVPQHTEGEWVARLARAVADAAADAASHGDYRRACKMAELNELFLPPWVGEMLGESEFSLEECPPWLAFRAACELADRIDSFLAAVGRGAQGAGLAADCRQCLDTLLVLADWCDDRGRPAAAAEARRLHALASSLP